MGGVGPSVAAVAHNSSRDDAKARAAVHDGLVGPPGFHTTAREPKRAHFRVLAFKTPPKFHEKTPRDTETAKRWRIREEKERNFGRSGGGGV